ncbi:MAG: DUF6600 domain-containing protein [Kofleriaceae bacterium]
MRTFHSSALVAIAFAGGCVSQTDATPEYGGDYAGISSGPSYESSDGYGWSGPPGGAIDPGFGYDDPSLAGSPSAQGADPSMYGGAMYGGAMYGGQTYGDAWADPNASGGEPAVWAGATAEVTDAEIDVTLEAYGEWVEDVDYGRVWRPSTTVVGADFTPYESCGSWIYTDYGWTFQSCDAWSWGWLPFHFGRWVFLDSGWCWSRDYTWGPGWVEWRHGRDYVGVRPMRPTRQIRDHRDRFSGPRIRDHRRGKHDEWRFTRTDDFGRGQIRRSSITVHEGLRETTSVAQPPLRGDVRKRASTVMAGRLRDHQRFEARTRGTIGQSTRGYQPAPSRTQGVDGARGSFGAAPSTNLGNRAHGYGSAGYTAPSRGPSPTRNPSGVTPDRNRPTWNRGNTGYRAPGSRPTPSWNGSPSRPTPAWGGSPSSRPTQTWNGSPSGPAPAWGAQPPSRPSPTWGGSRNTAPSTTRPSTNWSGPRSSPPARNYNPPSRSTYSPPSRASAPSRSSSTAPSRSSSSPSRSYSSPSRSSSSSSSRGSSSSSSSRGSSSGGRGGRSR